MKRFLEFVFATTITAPKLIVEDGLRGLGVNVPAKGINYNEKGQSISEIWKESSAIKRT